MMKYAGDLISALIRHVRLHSKNAVSNFGNTRQPQRKLKNNVQKCASPSSSEKSCMFPVRRQPLVAIGIIMAAKEEVRQSSSQLREAVRSKMHMTFPQEAAILVQRATKSHCQWFFTERDVSICRIRSFLVKDATQLLGQARQNHRGAPCFQSTQILPCDPPPSSTGFLSQPTSDSTWRYSPSKPSTELHPSTSRHWSDTSHRREQTKVVSAKSRLFSALPPQWWNELPPSVMTAESLAIFRKRLETHSFRLHLHPA